MIERVRFSPTAEFSAERQRLHVLLAELADAIRFAGSPDNLARLLDETEAEIGAFRATVFAGVEGDPS